MADANPVRGERLDGAAQEAAAVRGEVFDLDWPEPHRKWVATVDDTPAGGVYWLGHRTDEGDRAAYGVDFTAPLTVAQLHRLPIWQLPQPAAIPPDLQQFLA
ncbi:hypothetical protein [Amycolatopsis sp. WGS_07]|uniref:hypothetical protein n=1 Tax=Amycolatopsis sp. WGS_07 TaxID=3076764 RepID=UPI003873C68C